MAKYKLSWAEFGYTAYPHESEHQTFVGAIIHAIYAMLAYDTFEIRITTSA